jgi:hypothetical protein
MKDCNILKLSTAVLLALFISQQAHAIHVGANDLPYGQSVDHPLDSAVNEKYGGKAFFMNLGPTGIRARIDPDAPRAFKVTYVFQDDKSPAKGKIAIGDHIVGANGKNFSTDHGFHRKRAGARGWQGPPFELALAIEDSQGKDGLLELTVLKGGVDRNRETVTLQLEPVGRFSETYPWNCPRSDALLKKLLDFVFEDGVPKGRPSTIQCILALWASGDKRAEPLVKSQAEGLMKARRSASETGMVSWMWGYAGIFLGEYYNAYKDKGVMDAVEALNMAFEKGMDYRSGGFSHRPFPAIEARIAGGGPKGYGSMAGPGGLSMLAQSTFRATGLPYSERAYNRTHQAYLGSTGQNESGTLAYGFGGGWNGTLIRLKDPNSPCDTDEGFGYQCPTGMKDIGEFVVEHWFKEGSGWSKKMVPPTGEYDWLVKEADNLLVYKTGHYLENPSIQQRMVIRPHLYDEPTKPYSNNHKGGGHNAPVGMGALAHFIGNKGNTSWNYLGKHMATGCAYSPQTLWDGHASAEMHAFFGILGASRADEADFRHFLDYTKTWIILSETHDGKGLIEQPFGCQRNSTCSIARNRKIYTYNAILLLSLPKRKLLITGADSGTPAPATTSSSASTASTSGSTYVPPWRRQAAVKPPPEPLRDARTISDEKRAVLDRALLRTLGALSDDGMLQPKPLKISMTPAPIWLKAATKDGALTFELVNGSQEASIDFSELPPKDQATLALLVVGLKPESTDAKAMAAVYMEILGLVKQADDLFVKAGDASKTKLESLFD